MHFLYITVSCDQLLTLGQKNVILCFQCFIALMYIRHLLLCYDFSISSFSSAAVGFELFSAILYAKY